MLQGQIEHYGRATDSEWALCGGDFARSQPPPRVRRDGQRHDGFMIGVSGHFQGDTSLTMAVLPRMD